jgi:succinoglycan biosynthesis protein ExoM
MLRSALLATEPGPFDISFGLATGEDDELLLRLLTRGSLIIWCDEALVWEPVEAKRLSLRYLMKRALSGGQHFAHLSIAGRLGKVNAAILGTLFLQWLAQMLLALLLAVLVWPAGKHRAAVWLIKAWANLGKLTGFFNWRYAAYA